MIPTAVRACSPHELDAGTELLQTGFWAAFKKRFGWDSHPLLLEYKDFRAHLLVLSRSLAPGIGLSYVPFGPSIDEPELHREEFLLELGLAVAPHLPDDTVLIRFDLPWHRIGEDDRPRPLVTGKWLRKSRVDIQPASTVILDIRPEEQDLLAGMKRKWRYNIGLSKRRGVRVVEDRGSRLEDWYRLHQQTAERDRIAIHSIDYYRTLFDLSRTYGAGAPDYRLLLAETEERVIAGIVVGFRGPTAWYPYGASSNHARNLMPNYALQWRGIQLARDHGCRTYDFYGIPPSDEPGHPMHGLYRFKTGFGGRIIHRLGCYDVIFRPMRYNAYRRAEGLRDWYFKTLRKRSSGRGAR